MVHRFRFVFILGAALIITLLSAAFVVAGPLSDGARVVFLGDSITEQHDYTRYVMDYFALRYPDLAITFRNAGWSGDTAEGGLKRLPRDVLDLKPTLVTICFGMNDGGYTGFEQARYDRYRKAMTVIVQTLKRQGVQVVLLTPGVVDEDIANKGYNKTLARYAEGVKELAAQEQVPVYDIHALMGEVQAKVKKGDPKWTMLPDSVHPVAPGSALMAYGLLKAMGAGEPASSVRIDAGQKRAVADRAIVQNLEVTPDAISFTRVDRALPTYFDPDAAAVFAYVPIQHDLNGYLLQITGLKEGNWKLVVQDIPVGTFTAEEFAQGVDLGGRPGPWQKLGEQVNQNVAGQEWTYFLRWRMVQVNLDTPKEAEPEKLALERKLDQIIARKEQARAELVSPQAWQWTLTREP